MTRLHVRHVASHLQRRFSGLIDLADVSSRPTSEKEQVFLSRALAAFILSDLCEIEPSEAGQYVTDGFDDNGIDAIYFSQYDKVLYVVQSKWDAGGSSFPDLGEIHKFLQGFDDLINARWERFNDKFRRHTTLLDSGLDEIHIRFQLVLAHTGSQKPSRHAEQVFRDALDKHNEIEEIVESSILNLATLHRKIAEAADGTPIDLEVMLHDWGIVQEPYAAYYGQIEAADIAGWWKEHGPRLFTKNIRRLIQKSDVNDGLDATLRGSPQKFWYFNNGITALCSRISKKPLGGDSRKSGSFVCEGVSIVNGAQTVGRIGAAFGEKCLQSARVMVRFISLENCPPEFSTEVTRATNTQNRVERRDFASLDPEQERIRRELLMDTPPKTYAYKTGELEPQASDGCTFVEAAIALACAHSDPELAVTAKREVSRLWEDIERPPYKLLFNSGVSGARVWHAVEIKRAVDAEIDTIKSIRKDRDKIRHCAIHGNRMILHLILQALDPRRLGDIHFDIEEARTFARSRVLSLATQFERSIAVQFEGAYIANVFKNAARCKKLCASVTGELVNR